MKNNYLYFATIISIIVIGFFLLNNSGGPSVARSGSPLEGGATCVTCHNSFALNSGTGSVSISGITNYISDNIYNITVTVSQSSPTPVGFGFQGIVLTASNAVAGALAIIDSGTKLKAISGKNYIEHNAPGTSGVWTFQWTAPSTDVGDVLFYFTGNAANGNSSTSGDRIYSSVTTISPAATPAATLVLKTDVLCNGGNDGAIDIAVSGGTSPYTFLWSNDTTTQNISNLSAGTYSVTITDAASATTTLSILVSQPDSITVTTSSTPSVDGTCNGTVSANISGGTSPYSYQWFDSLGNIVTENNLCAGMYIFNITDANGCTKSGKEIVLDSATGIAENNFSDDVKIFPNPNDGNFTIGDLKSEINRLEIYNVLGEKIFSTDHIQHPIFNIRLTPLKGIFFLKLFSENAVAYQTIIVQ